MKIIDIESQLPAGCWVNEISHRYPNVDIKVLSFSLNNKGTCISQVYIRGLSKDMESIMNKNPNIVRIYRCGGYGSIKSYIVIYNCPAVELFKDLESPLILPFDVREGKARWKVDLDTYNDVFKRFLSKLNSCGLKWWIKRRFDKRLTKRQTEILMYAIKEGYYEYPRRISLTELARKIGISKSYLSETLKKIESKIFSDIIE